MTMIFDFLRRFGSIPGMPEMPPLVAVVRLTGIIVGGQLPLRGGVLNLANLEGVLVRAFSIRGLKAVALAINSPGGSPVQSALIAGRIRQLSAEKKVPVIAFAEDVAASGGYWLALAADEVYADANSIIGSIGVIQSGFGFTNLIERLGVERRVRAVGARKSFHDAFAPEKPEDLERIDRLLAETHQNFIDYVRQRRAGKLAQPEDAALFSGEFWTGSRAKALGLIDGIGDLNSTLRARFGERVRLIPVGRGRPWWLRYGLAESNADAGADDFSVKVFSATEAAMAALEARALWSRYGL
jgi:signal peptide peptidase SppA